MTQFNRTQLNLLRKQLQAAIDAADIYGITIDVGNYSYTGGEATFKVKCILDGADVVQFGPLYTKAREQREEINA